MGEIESEISEPQPDDLIDRLRDVNAPEPSDKELAEREQAKRRHPSVDGLPKPEPPTDENIE